MKRKPDAISTSSAAEGGDDDYIYRQDWASVHLDLLAEEKGLHKKGNPILE